MQTQLNAVTPLMTSGETFLLRLYVAGQTPKCVRAFENLAIVGLNVLRGQLDFDHVQASNR